MKGNALPGCRMLRFRAVELNVTDVVKKAQKATFI